MILAYILIVFILISLAMYGLGCLFDGEGE